MTKLEAKVVAAVLVWHAVNAIKGRPLVQKQDKQLRVAAKNLLKKQDDQLTVNNLAIADPARTDPELVKRTEAASRRLSIYASALPSLGKTGTGGRVRRFLLQIVTAFEVFDRSVERAHARQKGPSSRTSRAKRLSQKG